MDRNIIVTAQPDGRITVNTGGLEMTTVDGLQLALTLARTAAEFLADMLIEAKVKAATEKDDDGDG